MDTPEIERKAYSDMLKWKEGEGRTALLIDGARRVGKTHLVKKFGLAEYRSMLFIDFSDVSPAVLEIFEKDSWDRDMFFLKLQAQYGVKLHERESLIVFDEIQLYPRARQLIKHLVEDGRYDYIETGSLISIKTNVQDILIPSEERHIRLDPLDFGEFLQALGEDASIEVMTGCFEQRIPLGEALHRKLMNLFRLYMMTGGMPQPVCEYLRSKDLSEVESVKQDILNTYRADITRFADGYKERVNAVFDSIPSQLSRKKKRFKLSTLGKNARSRDYDDAFMWLEDGMMINQCFNSVDPNYGLSMSTDHASHKCYMADTGLLVTSAVLDEDGSDPDICRSILLDRLNINEGMFMENIVAQSLKTAGHRLYFYSRNDSRDRSNEMEIDFLVKRNGKVCPVEVKSSTYRKHSSLDKFRTKFKDRIGESFVLCTRDVSKEDGITYLPIYMAMLL